MQGRQEVSYKVVIGVTFGWQSCVLHVGLLFFGDNMVSVWVPFVASLGMPALSLGCLPQGPLCRKQETSGISADATRHFYQLPLGDCAWSPAPALRGKHVAFG